MASDVRKRKKKWMSGKENAPLDFVVQIEQLHLIGGLVAAELVAYSCRRRVLDRVADVVIFFSSLQSSGAARASDDASRRRHRHDRRRRHTLKQS